MVESTRISELNSAPQRDGGYVLYWMQQSQRAHFNPALETAVAAANRLQLPVLVGFGLTDSYPGANARHYAFMLEGLAETARDLHARGIGFVVCQGAPDEVAIRLSSRAALLVCDRGYLRPQKEWRANVAKHSKCRALQVEGDVIVPVDLASNKAEAAARTLRPKLMRWRDEFLKPLRAGRPQVSAARLRASSDIDLSDISVLLKRLKLDRSASPISTFRGGHSEARRRLKAFIRRDLDSYAEGRVSLGEPHVSTLSPYLHFGQISPVEIALAVRDANGTAEGRARYLEELIVRRELAMNFVNFVADYDRYTSIPEWARRTLSAHRRDRREYLYDYSELAQAETHDPYWNAAMREMLATGYTHNHMRMYWGKKVLEWSPSPEEGYAVLLGLNDTYFLDGRDVNSYANVGWIFGLHDRPWPERPVFGKVRYMNAAGLRRKTDIEAYLERIARLTGEAPSRAQLSLKL